MKKVLSVVLAVLMLAAIAAVPVFADDAIAVTTADEFLLWRAVSPTILPTI